MADKIYYNHRSSFSYNGMTVHTVGYRYKVKVGKFLFWFAIGLLILPITMLIVDLSFDDGLEAFWIGVWIYIGMYALITLCLIPEMINAKIMYPSIGLREDGVFVIFHSNTNVSYLQDKITDVLGVRHVSTTAHSSSNRIGNTVYTTTTYTTTTHTWGKVIFTLRNAEGQAYKKVAVRVTSVMDTANKIKGMIK